MSKQHTQNTSTISKQAAASDSSLTASTWASAPAPPTGHTRPSRDYRPASHSHASPTPSYPPTQDANPESSDTQSTSYSSPSRPSITASPSPRHPAHTRS